MAVIFKTRLLWLLNLGIWVYFSLISFPLLSLLFWILFLIYMFTDYLRYLLKNKIKKTVNITAAAALGGNLECLKYAFLFFYLFFYLFHSSRYPFYGYKKIKTGWFISLIFLFFFGFNKFFRFAHKSGCGWNSFTCTQAAKGGSLECLRLFFLNKKKRGGRKNIAHSIYFFKIKTLSTFSSFSFFLSI